MSKQNEMMAKALKEYMQMRADDIEEVKQYYDTSGVLSKEEIDRVVAEIKAICEYKGETK